VGPAVIGLSSIQSAASLHGVSRVTYGTVEAYVRLISETLTSSFYSNRGGSQVGVPLRRGHAREFLA